MPSGAPSRRVSRWQKARAFSWLLKTVGSIEATKSYQEMYWALSWLRWVTLASLLLLAFLNPTPGRAGLDTPALLLVFIGYHLPMDLLARRLSARLPIVPIMAILDLLVAGLAYFLAGDPGNILFILFVLAIICAAAGFNVPSTLIYTAMAVAVVTIIDTVSRPWPPSDVGIYGTGFRAVSLTVVGLGTTILARRLRLEEEAARSSRDEAERLAALDHLRANFVARVSHDLRTPLTAIRAALGGLLERNGGSDPQQEEHKLLLSGLRNAERLSLLIDDLIAMNQLEAGVLHLERERFDLRDVVLETLSILHPLFRHREQTLEIDLPEPLPVEGDPRRLEQALVNVLDNAHRHGPVRSRLVISAYLKDEVIVLSVHDTGPGIPPEHLENVFRPFHRLDDTARGSGLGLSIARRLIEMHEGRIWIESRPGEGTTVHIALPIVVGEVADDIEVAHRRG
jgi:signal transduction histidine kinase